MKENIKKLHQFSALAKGLLHKSNLKVPKGITDAVLRFTKTML